RAAWRSAASCRSTSARPTGSGGRPGWWCRRNEPCPSWLPIGLALWRPVGSQPEQGLAEFDELAVGHQDALDHARGLGLDAGEHFHHLDEPDGRARRDLGADLDIG